MALPEPDRYSFQAPTAPGLTRTAARRSRRAACPFLHPPRTRLGTADTHGVPSPVGAPGLATEPHASSEAQTPPGRRYQDGPDPPAACPSPALAPAGLRMRRRRAAVPRCPRRPAQRKPLRPDLAPGPRRNHPGGRDRHPAGAPPLRPSPCRAVAVAGLRRPAGRDRCPRRAQRACPAHHLRPRHTRLRPDRQPADRARPPPQPMAPRWPTTIHADARNPVRHASVPQLDSTGHSWT